MIQVIPAISEKTISLVSMNQYSFWVNRKSSQSAIKLAIEDQFKVKVKRVNIHNRHGRRRNPKMAIVTLAEGYKIKDFGPQEQPKVKK